MSAPVPHRTRELDHRVSDGIDVRLLWREDAGTLFVAVDDAKTGDSFSFDVRDRARALHAFHHPFVYRPSGAAEPAGRDAARDRAQLGHPEAPPAGLEPAT